jgi:hypothetical protein
MKASLRRRIELWLNVARCRVLRRHRVQPRAHIPIRPPIGDWWVVPVDRYCHRCGVGRIEHIVCSEGWEYWLDMKPPYPFSPLEAAKR